MGANNPGGSSRVRYQPDDKLSATLSLGLGFQIAALSIAGVILIPTVVMRAANASEAYLSWAVFTAVAIGGAATMLQAARIGRIGAGYILAMGPSAAFISVCITAVAEGGPGMLATLVVITAFVPLLLSWRLSLFQRFLTPTVAGTVIMLIPITVMPAILNLLSATPPDAPALAAPLSALATICIISGLALKGTGAWRLWAPIVGVVAGSILGGFFGLYDIHLVSSASWIGVPANEWPGLHFDFGPTFRALLPAFLLVAVINAVRTISSAVAIQRISWRTPRAVDSRAVQGALAADGISTLVSGFAGTMPNTAYTVGVSVTDLTGVGARSVGVAAGATFVAMAFLPKALALILAIPGPVVAAYLAVLLAALFVVGIKIIVQDGINYRNGLIVGVAFFTGVGFQSGMIFPEYISEFAGGFLENGMTAGGFVAILMTLFVELTAPRRSRLEMSFDFSDLPQITDFLQAFASRNGLDAAMANRLDAAAEETLLTLIPQDEEKPARRLRLVAYKEEGDAVLEFVVSSGEENLQDQIALLSEHVDETPVEREVSLRLLRHLASSVRHQQYRETDIVTVRMKT